MSITDELRAWAKEHLSRSSILAIADRIDAEHERMLGDWDYWESTHIELPKDADGEYIHVGDEMCGYGWPNGGVYCRAIVNEVTILVGPQDGAYRGWLMWAANECRHYHEPTVEDVLREFTDAILEWSGKSGTVAEVGTWSDVAAEYATKLKLAEEEDA